MQKNVDSVNHDENIASLMWANVFMGDKSVWMYCLWFWDYWKKSLRESIVWLAAC